MRNPSETAAPKPHLPLGTFFLPCTVHDDDDDDAGEDGDEDDDDSGDNSLTTERAERWSWSAAFAARAWRFL